MLEELVEEEEKLAGRTPVVPGKELTVQVTKLSQFQQTKIWRRKSCKRVEEAEIVVKMPACRQNSNAASTIFFLRLVKQKKCQKQIKNLKNGKTKT